MPRKETGTFRLFGARRTSIRKNSLPVGDRCWRQVPVIVRYRAARKVEQPHGHITHLRPVDRFGYPSNAEPMVDKQTCPSVPGEADIFQLHDRPALKKCEMARDEARKGWKAV